MRGFVAKIAVFGALVAGPAFGHSAPDSFADLAERLLPAVVNISSTQTVTAAKDKDKDQGGAEDQTPFEQFFRDYMNRRQHGGDDGDQSGDQGGDDDSGVPNDGKPHHTQSLGSGFIIDPSGIVVTNNHVIDGADEISVILQDNTTLKAKVLGHDDRTDLAVLKVEAKKPLPFVQFGDSDKSRVGDWVLAIGNPFGLGGSVTAGIISARGRDIQQGPYDDFIQTDAPINRGNSGGPLFNLAGDVVGINTAIYSPSGGSIGIGFAIPSSEAQGVVAQLRTYGHTRRGWLGVRIQQVTPDIAETLGLPDTDGALVAGITAGGPADRAHIQNGDVIRKFNGQALHEMRNLPRVVAQTDLARHVPVEIWRQGKPQIVDVVVAEMPEDTAPVADAVKKPEPVIASEDVAEAGIKIAPVSDELKQKYKLDADQKGVVITEVAADGVGADRGMRPGDVVLEVQQHPVNTPAELLARLRSARLAGRKSVLLLITGSDGLSYVPIPLTSGHPGGG